MSQEVLQAMLTDGRLALDRTIVWRQGMKEWRSPARVAELAPRAAPATCAVRQPPPGMVTAVPPQMNGMALASLILGIVSFVMGALALTGIPAVICGHIARRQIRENPLTQSGDGMAVGGLVTGYLSILLSVVMVVFFVVFVVIAINAASSATPPGGIPMTVTPTATATSSAPPFAP